jgi:hypothetical protein
MANCNENSHNLISPPTETNLNQMFNLRKRLGGMQPQEMAVVILVFAVTSIVAVISFAYIYTALPNLGTGTPANLTVTAFATNFYAAIQLLGVALIVMAAVTIIGVILWLRGRA